MRNNYKRIMGLALLAFLALAPSVAVAGQFSLSQEPDLNDLFQTLMTEGAEAVYVMVDPEGVPAVIYGQLGTPSDVLGLEDESLYGGCLGVILAATHGELLQYVFNLIGVSGEGGVLALANNYAPAQTGLPTNITDILGTEFSLLLGLYLDLDAATSQSRMSAVLSRYTTQFGFSFSSLLSLRIDQSIMPTGVNNTLPFDSLDIYIYQIANDFQAAVNAVFQVMDDTGFLGAIDTEIFARQRAAAAGLVAIPDISALVDLFGGFTGGGGPMFALSSTPFEISQIENLTGPIAFAAAGYIGEQVVSSSSTSLGVADLLGASSMPAFTSGLSVVIIDMPENANITSFTPIAGNYSFYDNTTERVFWNATYFGAEPDYVVYFNSDDFPPLIVLERAFAPNPTVVGGSTEVTVTISNQGDAPIYNVTLNDVGVSNYYSNITVTGTTSRTIASIAPDTNETMTYTVAFVNEGSYTFPGAVMTYEYNGKDFVKSTHVDGLVVDSSIGGLLYQGLMDGMPYTGAALLVVGLVGLYSIRGIVKGRGKSATYQV
jgi:hypothetical protein